MKKKSEFMKLIAALVPFGEATLSSSRRLALCFALAAAVVAAGTVPAGDCPKALENRDSPKHPEIYTLGQSLLAPGTRFGTIKEIKSADGELIHKIVYDERGRKKCVLDRNDNLLEEYEYTEEFGDVPARIILTNIKDGVNKVQLRLREKPWLHSGTFFEYKYQLYDPETGELLPHGLDYRIWYRDTECKMITHFQIMIISLEHMTRFDGAHRAEFDRIANRGIGTTLINWIATMAQEENVRVFDDSTPNEYLVRIYYRLFKNMLVDMPADELKARRAIEARDIEWKLKETPPLEEVLRLLKEMPRFRFRFEDGVPNPIRIVREKGGRVIRYQGGEMLPQSPRGTLAQPGGLLAYAKERSVGHEVVNVPIVHRVDGIDGIDLPNPVVDLSTEAVRDIIESKKAIRLDLSDVLRLAEGFNIYSTVRTFLFNAAYHIAITFSKGDPRAGQVQAIICEVLKNAFYHGNKLNFKLPIFLYVELDKEGHVTSVECFDMAVPGEMPWMEKRAAEGILGGNRQCMSMIDRFGWHYERKAIITGEGKSATHVVITRGSVRLSEAFANANTRNYP